MIDINVFFKDGKFVKQSVRAKKYDKFFQELSEKYGTNNRSELLWLQSNIRPVCRLCGKLTKFLNYESGYRQLCSDACARKDPLTKDRRVSSIKGFFLRNHGVSNPMQLEKTKNTVSLTNKERHGAPWYVETESFKSASKQTSIKNWGTEFPQQSEELKLEIRQKIFNKYGRTTARTFDEQRIQRFKEVREWCEEMMIEYPQFDVSHPLESKLYSFTHSCGFRWEQSLITLPSCKVCHRGSKVEQNLKEWIKTLGIEVIFNDRRQIAPLELDIFIPSKNIAIEMNGLYWHHDGSGRTSIKEKTDICQKYGIQLISIWEHEWTDELQKKKIKGVILAKLGLTEKIFARKTSIRSLTLQECRNFMNENHLQGWASNRESYGLFLNGELVMAMSTGVRRWNGGADIEIIRLCSKIGVTVVGGFSKLLSKYTNKTIVSYCDRRFGSGAGYERVGFILDGISKPNYLWWKGNTFLKRGSTTKKRLPALLGEFYNPLDSENGNMISAGWRKLSDAGNLRYFLPARKTK